MQAICLDKTEEIRMKTAYVCSVLLLSVATLAACKGAPVKTEQVQVKVVESIPAAEMPKWAKSSQDFWEDKDNYLYRSIAEGFANLETAKRAAQAGIQTSIAEQIKNTVRTEFARALEAGMYEENTGGYVKEIFFSAVENLTVSGVVLRESYLQRLHEYGLGRDKLYYRAYVLGSISKQNYRQLVNRAFTDAKAQVSANKDAKQLVAETETRFWQNQEKRESL